MEIFTVFYLLIMSSALQVPLCTTMDRVLKKHLVVMVMVMAMAISMLLRTKDKNSWDRIS